MSHPSPALCCCCLISILLCALDTSGTRHCIPHPLRPHGSPYEAKRNEQSLDDSSAITHYAVALIVSIFLCVDRVQNVWNPGERRDGGMGDGGVRVHKLDAGLPTLRQGQSLLASGDGTQASRTSIRRDMAHMLALAAAEVVPGFTPSLPGCEHTRSRRWLRRGCWSAKPVGHSMSHPEVPLRSALHATSVTGERTSLHLSSTPLLILPLSLQPHHLADQSLAIPIPPRASPSISQCGREEQVTAGASPF